MDELLVAQAIALPVVTGLVEVAKQTGVPSKLAPLASLLLGVLVMVLLAWSGALEGMEDPISGSTILGGLISGLGASGLYSGGKAVKEATT
jgi:hypothetical protein